MGRAGNFVLLAIGRNFGLVIGGGVVGQGHGLSATSHSVCAMDSGCVADCRNGFKVVDGPRLAAKLKQSQRSDALRVPASKREPFDYSNRFGTVSNPKRPVPVRIHHAVTILRSIRCAQD